MLEKYTEIYKEFLEKVTELHNAHIGFTQKPTNKSCRRLRKAIGQLKEHMNPFRMEVFQLQKEYSEIQKQIWLDHKEQIRLKTEAKEQRKLLKENKK
jgi:predicted  nucleic acid-binding Zn-ribbon protein